MSAGFHTALGAGCVVLGLLFLAYGIRGRHDPNPSGIQLSGRETMVEGVAIVLLGIGNLLHGPGSLLVIPVAVAFIWLMARLVARRVRARRRPTD